MTKRNTIRSLSINPVAIARRERYHSDESFADYVKNINNTRYRTNEDFKIKHKMVMKSKYVKRIKTCDYCNLKFKNVENLETKLCEDCLKYGVCEYCDRFQNLYISKLGMSGKCCDLCLVATIMDNFGLFDDFIRKVFKQIEEGKCVETTDDVSLPQKKEITINRDGSFSPHQHVDVISL